MLCCSHLRTYPLTQLLVVKAKKAAEFSPYCCECGTQTDVFKKLTGKSGLCIS